MGDAAITVGRQEKHLSLPTVRTQRPAVTEDDGLTRTPVLVVNLRAVFGGDRIHVLVSLVIDSYLFLNLFVVFLSLTLTI
jgi:hypothetical protein